MVYSNNFWKWYTLYRATPFGVTSPEKQLMTVTTTEANNIADFTTCMSSWIYCTYS
ncbi:MAG: hypothetical protein CM15mV54_410 [Caudoviricetes sp.]|nr:MAG: hypothetical protein CM15mV54_410 [Caudoviricetes sp.]